MDAASYSATLARTLLAVASARNFLARGVFMFAGCFGAIIAAADTTVFQVRHLAFIVDCSFLCLAFFIWCFVRALLAGCLLFAFYARHLGLVILAISLALAFVVSALDYFKFIPLQFCGMGSICRLGPRLFL
jgi:hypothetical protein